MLHHLLAQSISPGRDSGDRFSRAYACWWPATLTFLLAPSIDHQHKRPTGKQAMLALEHRNVLRRLENFGFVGKTDLFLLPTKLSVPTSCEPSRPMTLLHVGPRSTNVAVCHSHRYTIGSPRSWQRQVPKTRKKTVGSFERQFSAPSGCFWVYMLTLFSDAFNAIQIMVF